MDLENSNGSEENSDLVIKYQRLSGDRIDTGELVLNYTIYFHGHVTKVIAKNNEVEDKGLFS